MPRFAANLTMLFGELPFLDRFAAAKAAGFGGVEYLFPYDFEKGGVARAVAAAWTYASIAQSPGGRLGSRRGG